MWHSLAKPLAWAIFTAAILLLATYGSKPALAQTPDTSIPLTRDTITDVTQIPFQGDLDGMIQRRQIRILVPYSKTFYFIDRGTQRGLAYDLGRQFEDELNKKLKTKHVRVHAVFRPVARDQFIPMLLDGRGDIAIGNFTVTADRQKLVDFAATGRTNVSEIVVTAPGTQPLSSLDELAGREVYIRKTSSYFESVQTLNEALAKAGRPPVAIRLAPETLETEDILEMVNAGLVGATIVDSHLADFWRQIFTKIHLNRDAVLRSGGQTAVMIRPNSPLLKAELNEFSARHPEGSKTRAVLLQQYFKNTRWAKAAVSKQEMAKFEDTIKLFREYGARYDLDPLIVMSQAYQESGLRQDAKSRVGAIGVMQLMPETGAEMKVGDITRIESNVHAGTKYMRLLMDRYFRNEPMDALNKALFTFAAYNAGPGRVRSLRRETAKRGLDPNVWFNNVELVTAQKIGRETVQYVSNIYKYYLAYSIVAEEIANREASKSAIKKIQ